MRHANVSGSAGRKRPPSVDEFDSPYEFFVKLNQINSELFLDINVFAHM